MLCFNECRPKRVLRLGENEIPALADWNQRDDRAVPLNFWEKPVMRQLLDQRSRPAFSVKGFSEPLDVETADWTRGTLPSWMASLWQRPVPPTGRSAHAGRRSLRQAAGRCQRRRAMRTRVIERRIAWTPRRCAKS